MTWLPRTLIGLSLIAFGCASSADESSEPTAPVASKTLTEGASSELSEELESAEESVAAAPLGILFESLVDDPIARWLVVYDRVAWVASDLLVEEPEEKLALLGPEWFCYEDDNGWHAVFGKFDPETDQYAAHYHYRVDGEFTASVASDPVPPRLALAYARAIRASRPLLDADLGDIPLRMNTYVRPTAEGIDVWYLPAILPDGRCIAGGEFCFHFDGEGRKSLGKDVVFTKFVAFTPDPEGRIILSDPGRKSPSMGNLFFAYSHFERFDSIKIETDEYLSLLGKFDGEFSWIHLEKEAAAEPNGNTTND